MPILEHFDLIAPYYDKFIRSNDAERLIELLGLPTDGYVLDAGGGTGRISQHFTKLSERVIIADLSFPMLIQSREKTSLKPVCTSCETLPFEDNFFEAISIVDALHHVIDQEQTCTELWRVLKPGGRLIIEEPDLNRFAVKVLALVEKLLLMRSHLLTPEKIATYFKNNKSTARIEKQGLMAWVIVEKSV